MAPQRITKQMLADALVAAGVEFPVNATISQLRRLYEQLPNRSADDIINIDDFDDEVVAADVH